MIALCIITGAVFGWLLAEIVFAPLGYQDSTGFHRGMPQRPAHQRREGDPVRGEDQTHGSASK